MLSSRGWMAVAAVVSCLAIFGGIWLYINYQQAFGSGWGIRNTAHIVVHDQKFGMRAVDKAISYGDRILPYLTEESQNYQTLNPRNSLWLAQVLGAIKTEQSNAILKELYARPEHERFARMIGVIGLIQHDTLEGDWAKDEILLECIRGGEIGEFSQYSDLAIQSLGESKNPKAMPVIVNILNDADARAGAKACARAALLRLQSDGITADGSESNTEMRGENATGQ